MDNDTELRLGLPGSVEAKKVRERETPLKRSFSDSNSETDQNDEKPPAKTRVVGWPPVCSYRKNNLKKDGDVARRYIKVSMDGAPYLRKVDLRNFKGYQELREALEILFKCFSSPASEKLMEGNYKLSEYAITYEDKDGDLMLVGDVPWGMFVSICKKVRIMKNTS